MIAACHCINRRKQSGSAFSMNAAIDAGSVTFEGDRLKVYEDAGSSGLKVFRKFCGNCGSPVVSDVQAFAGLLFVKAGTLDDPSWVNPGAEIWCASKLQWANLANDLPKIAGNPPGS